MDFNDAVGRVLLHEGGYGNHPDDPGGATRYGITEAVARVAGYRGDMRELPLDVAKQIYKKQFWDAVRADELPIGLRYIVFDAAVNSGVGQSIKWLQRAVGVEPDGIFGPKTLRAVTSSGVDTVRMRLLAQRLRFMAGLPQWPSFSRGWSRRIADLMES